MLLKPMQNIFKRNTYRSKNPGPVVLHDHFLFPDGGGRVAIVMAKAFNAQLWAGEYDKKAFPEGYFGDLSIFSLKAYAAVPFWLKFTKTGQMWHAFSGFQRLLLPWTIFSGSLSLLAHKRIDGPKILYCHTPPRLLYDQKDFYFSDISPFKRPAMKLLISVYQKVYEEAVRDMDIIIANSKNVQKRIKQYLARDSDVVYPPCDTTGFKWLGQEDYYLSTARLDMLKRVDVIVRAFLKMPDKNLVVISGGSELKRIRNMAQTASNITVLGWIDQPKLMQLTGRCIATIYIPRNEDFGMSPVESMAAGKPVIGVAEGGMLETVKDGETGILIKTPGEPDPEDVINSVLQMTAHAAAEMRSKCEARASIFGIEPFIKKMTGILSTGSGFAQQELHNRSKS